MFKYIIKVSFDFKMITLEQFDVEQHVRSWKKPTTPVLIGIVVIWLLFEILNPGFSSSDKKINIHNNKLSSAAATTTKTTNKARTTRQKVMYMA